MALAMSNTKNQSDAKGTSVSCLIILSIELALKLRRSSLLLLKDHLGPCGREGELLGTFVAAHQRPPVITPGVCMSSAAVVMLKKDIEGTSLTIGAGHRISGCQ